MILLAPFPLSLFCDSVTEMSRSVRGYSREILLVWPCQSPWGFHSLCVKDAGNRSYPGLSGPFMQFPASILSLKSNYETHQQYLSDLCVPFDTHNL